MPENQTTKECTKCGEPYPATTEYFAPASRNKSGLHSWCRNCTRAGNRESQKRVSPEIRRERARKSYSRRREKILERNRQHKKTNKERVEKKAREYYEKNRQYIIEKQRERDGSIKMDEDNYADLVPMDGVDTFRAWAVITSGEYGYILQKGVDSVAGRDVE